jgi:regulator of protease activity HflC (stomatin/prohibitin superfamily)
MTWFVLTVVVALIVAGSFVYAAGAAPAPAEGRFSGTRGIAFAVAGVAVSIWLLLTLFFFTFTTVAAGHVGLVKTFADYTDTMSPGWNAKLPWQTVEEADVRVQSHRILMDGQEGHGTAVSAETQPVYAVVTINYQLDPVHVLELYRTVGSHYYESIIEPRVQQVFKSMTVEYRTVDVAPNREEIRRDTQQTLDAQLEQYGVNVSDFLINDLDFAPAFVDAITEKQVATQQAEAARAKVEQAKAEADQKIETARGEAESIAIRGRALRDNPEILQLEAINKLNPNVQTIYLPSGGNVLFNLPQGTGAGR